MTDSYKIMITQINIALQIENLEITREWEKEEKRKREKEREKKKERKKERKRKRERKSEPHVNKLYNL